MDIQQTIDRIHNQFRDLRDGTPASYIPALAQANPDSFAIAVVTREGEVFQSGDSQQPFSMQSTSKPFSYGMVLQEQGRGRILKKIGVEPTGEAFNSIVELEKHTHRPYNPMINSGAIDVELAWGEPIRMGRKLSRKEATRLAEIAIRRARQEAVTGRSRG